MIIRKSKYKKILEIISQLEVDDVISKDSIIEEVYSEKADYFIRRSFDVIFCRAKKDLPDRKFISRQSMITRTD